MTEQSTSGNHESWSSRWTFLFATIGASVGLGNLWRFPYVAGENGGGAFVLLYLGIVFLIGLPLCMAELSMGRMGHQSPINTMRKLCRDQNANSFWHIIGWFSVISPIIAICFYSTVAAWSLDYLYLAMAGVLKGIEPGKAQIVFDELLASPTRMGLWHSLYILLSVVVVGLGVRRGIEMTTKLMMPTLFVLLVILVIYSHIIGDPGRAWAFLFDPDFSRVTPKVILMSLGQALFSIAVATGALITYGSYLPRNVKIPGSSVMIVCADTSVALLAGLAIFSIVFASGISPEGGPGLMFISLPVAFAQMPAGYFFSILFFLLVFITAFTSSLVMIEPLVSWAIEHKGLRRFPVTAGIGLFVWIAGLASVFSFNIWKEVKPLNMIPLFEGKTFFAVFDFGVSNVMLPLNALLLALFAGWVLSKAKLKTELGLQNERWFTFLIFLLRYIAPVAVGAVVVSSFTMAA